MSWSLSFVGDPTEVQGSLEGVIEAAASAMKRVGHAAMADVVSVNINGHGELGERTTIDNISVSVSASYPEQKLPEEADNTEEEAEDAIGL